ncbi:hypothetical protein Poli38472_009255 [Pythium oligandrum]|uniref:Uncharacterized protein n=1 Tax=Pythium oligandrum TaxID=41045 RepID=A0A8K1CLD7_PYTOL|nr:hypothetical protein Poli38472_009255 [Pythium oligandrum]|eukprot:TMW65088.1 hypothetical protein Poli38472_009255 [Pythium oligandrum]
MQLNILVVNKSRMLSRGGFDPHGDRRGEIHGHDVRYGRSRGREDETHHEAGNGSLGVHDYRLPTASHGGGCEGGVLEQSRYLSHRGVGGALGPPRPLVDGNPTCGDHGTQCRHCRFHGDEDEDDEGGASQHRPNRYHYRDGEDGGGQPMIHLVDCRRDDEGEILREPKHREEQSPWRG